MVRSAILGALIGAALVLVILLLDIPLYLLAIAPFIAGFIAGSAGGGVKAGLLTLIISLIFLIPTSTILVNPNSPLPNIPDTSGVGIAGGTLSALTNGLLGSTRATMGGLAALATQLGRIMAVLVLLSLALVVGIGLVASAIVGAIGGLFGKLINNSKQ
ncbi:MAG: hypothetical protein V1850_04100 [Candidatus Bathyarchaeota archaeon]